MKKRLMLLVALVMSFGAFFGFTGAAHADTSLNIQVTSVDVGAPAVSLTNTVLATPDGATQLLWWYPNHHIKVTMKAVKKAPQIKIHATGANASKKIAKKAHGATIVVLKKGSIVRNTGKNGDIVGGFQWKVTVAAVLKWNKQLGLYQHVFNWKGHHLTKECGNHIGGHVDKTYSKVKQVRYPSELEYNATVTATATATAHAELSGTCPDGTKVDFSTSVEGHGSAVGFVSYKEQDKASAVNATVTSLSGQFRASATAEATAKLQIKANVACGSTPPPPPTTQAPTINISAGACVNAGEQTGVINGNVGNPNDEAGSGTLTITPSGATKSISVAANNTASFTFSGLTAGTYTVSLSMFGKIVSDTATIGQCSTPPPAQSITITSLTQLNMIPAGDNSGEFSIGVNASAAGGSLVVDPGIGSVSACDSITKQDSLTFSNLGSGNSSLCVLLWAPNDADKPASMTVTFTANLGTAKDVKTETVPITYPTRP